MLSLPEAALYIGVPVGVLSDWAFAGSIPVANRSVHRPQFDRKALDEFLAKQKPAMDRALTVRVPVDTGPR